MSARSEAVAGLAPAARWGAIAAVVAGAAAFAIGVASGGAPRAFGVLIASWLFLAGAAMGAVAFRAIFRVIAARWAQPLAEIGGGLASFVPVAAALLVVILAGVRAAPWIPHPAGWLGTGALVVREVAVNAVLFGLAVAWFRRPAGGSGGISPRRAVTFSLAYAVVLSIWAFDFVLGPDPVAESTLVGPYLFMSAFTAGTDLVVLLGLRRGVLGERDRRDAASLVFALSVFWAYLFAAQFLTIWYGNLPEETGFALRRAVDGWLVVTLAVAALVWAIPFLGLLHPAGRRSPRLFAGILAGQLAGLWLNCQLLVVPSLAPRGTWPIGPRDLLIVAGMLGAFALSVARAPGRAPAREGG